MKKILGIVLALVFVAGVAMPAYAAKASHKKASAPKAERIVATVVSLDAATRTMVVTEEKSGASRTVKISAKAAAKVQVGDRVRIKLKPGTNESAGVRVLKPLVTADAAGQPVGEAAGNVQAGTGEPQAGVAGESKAGAMPEPAQK